MQDILDKFTGHLKSVLGNAHKMAAEMHSPFIQPEHLLLALLHQKGSIGGEILRKQNVSAEQVRRMMAFAEEMGRLNGEETPAHDGHAMPKLAEDAKRAVEKAVLTANVNEHKYVGTEHLLAGLLQIDAPTIEAVLVDQSINIGELKDQVATVLKSTTKFPEITETFEVGKAPVAMSAEDKAAAKKAAEKKPTAKTAAKKDAVAKTPGLDFFATELTNPKLQENIDPVIGRDKEVERAIQILCRRTKNNPVLLGEPGVGKTAIVEGLAKKILKGDVPEALQDKRIFALDLGLILAGTIYRGEFEGRIKQIIDELKANPEIILFIDELHNIMGAGSTNGSMDAANILKPALARGDMHCIGATTLAEFKKHIEADGAMERRFQPVMVEQPSAENAIKILQGLRENYEQYHGVTITDAAIVAAVELSERYITDRQLPDKAIDLIDEAAACVRVAAVTETETKRAKAIHEQLETLRAKKHKAVQGEKFIEALELKAKERDLEDELANLGNAKADAPKAIIGSIGRKEVAAVVARATGIPVNDLMKEEKDRLRNLEELLRARVVGQDEAVKSVADLVRRAKAGISNPDRPLASFLFLGPSGVGKTELAKTLAETVFQDPDALVRIDMSEFAEGFSASKLVGSPAGYVGYRDETKLTDVVKRKPHSIVLFDEIEKAHGDIHNLLLQILDDGHLTDATGRKINFRHCIIVMTSNVGANVLREKHVGFDIDGTGNDVSGEMTADTKAGVLEELERSFRPEFINRIDKVLVFSPLSQETLRSIVSLQMGELGKRLDKDYGVGLNWSAPVLAHIAEKAWNPLYGARGVRRQIQDLIENPLAKELLGDDTKPGDVIAVGMSEGEVAVSRGRGAAKAGAKSGRSGGRAKTKVKAEAHG